MSFIAAGVGLAGSAVSFFGNRKKQKQAEREQAKAKKQMMQQRQKFENMDISNPFANMQNQFAGLENTMEDLTVNQQEAQMMNQQGQQQRANIMDQMSGAAGGSGIAALAQQMAQSGQLASQQASAKIGAQERAAGYEEAKMGALSSGIGSLAGLSDRRAKENIELIGSSPSGIGIYVFEYKDKRFGEGKFQGAMSDEVPRDVVVKHESGYDMIDYSKIDVEFKSIK